MKQFNKFYLWGANVKFHMAIYTIAALFVKSIANLVQGIMSVEIAAMAQMLFVSLAFACMESILFPRGKEWGVTGWRVAIWAILANVLYVGAAFLFRWFKGIPVWCGVLIALIMECGLFAMWYALWLENKQDNQCLNGNLREFQKK